jgi:hypothetical protein
MFIEYLKKKRKKITRNKHQHFQEVIRMCLF